MSGVKEMQAGVLHFIKAKRELVDGVKPAVRLAYKSELIRDLNGSRLDDYVADRAPFFYRSFESILEDVKTGYFLSMMRSTLAKIPKSESFRESHFGEIVAGIFAEEVLGLKRIYSKLSLLTSENANAFKMDLVLYEPGTDPVRIYFGEVKCSPKSEADGLPSGHDKSCFADIFNSMNGYGEADKRFDITAAQDNLKSVHEDDREMVRKALLPYSGSQFSYIAFAVIDTSTFCKDEVQVIRTRRNSKSFEVDLICIESFSDVASGVYATLEKAGRA